MGPRFPFQSCPIVPISAPEAISQVFHWLGFWFDRYAPFQNVLIFKMCYLMTESNVEIVWWWLGDE
jgi:hypothetical protein